MLVRLIEFSLRHRLIVLLLFLALGAIGVHALKATPKDAIPDLSDVQVIVLTEFADQAPQIVEAQVTYPLTSALKGVPHARAVRGFSTMGTSFVYVIFEDGTDPYWARARVLEYLNAATRKLPQGVVPTLGPDASGVGWVFQYALVDTSGTLDLAQLRSLQDWYLRFELQSVDGVAEVAGVGGFNKQYQIEIDPSRLAAAGLSIADVREAVAGANNEFGGRLLELAETELMVRGLGYIRGAADIENIVIAPRGGSPARIADIGRVVIGPDFRRGIAELNGSGETVGGIVVMRNGYNVQTVIDDVKARLAELAQGLPASVRIIPVYDRSALVERAIDTLWRQLGEEMLIVALVCGLFLFHLRSSLVAVIVLPIGILFSFIMMRLHGVNASIMSLGGIAIAIGAMVDAAVVMIENAHKHFERSDGTQSRLDIILASTSEVGPVLFLCLLIITLSFLPVFALENQEARLFGPLALTKSYAMAGAALLSVTLVPVLMYYLLRGRLPREKDNPLNRALAGIYRPVLALALRFKFATVVIATLVALSALWPFARLGSEFMPHMDEGDLLYMPSTLPQISSTKIREVLQQSDRIIASFPEVASVFGKAGRADSATDPAPLMMLETTIQLKPRDQWRAGMTTQKLIDELDAALKLPGVTNSWTMPIKGRIDMLSTGIKSPIGVKIAGPDVNVLERIAGDIEVRLKRLPGARNVYAERNVGGRYLDLNIDRAALARYGLQAGEIEDIVLAAIGGQTVTTTVEGVERYGVAIRFIRAARDSPEAIARILVPLAQGGAVPLGQLAAIRISDGPVSIRSENARPNAWVYLDSSDRDIGAFVARAQRELAEHVALPTGYSMAWSGQYEAYERAKSRLQLIVPLTVVMIFVLLYAAFKEAMRPLMILISLPLALTGGFWFLYALDYQLSVAVAIGFIALAGVAAETGVLMLIYLDIAYRQAREREAAPFTRGQLVAIVMEGAAGRLRPKLMTVSAIIAGLLPIMWIDGAGSEIMRRIAAPMIGGMISSTLLTLFVIPAIYLFHLEREHRRAPAPLRRE